MLEVISNNSFAVVPAACYMCHLWHKLNSGCISAGNNGNLRNIKNSRFCNYSSEISLHTDPLIETSFSVYFL